VGIAGHASALLLDPWLLFSSPVLVPSTVLVYPVMIADFPVTGHDAALQKHAMISLVSISNCNRAIVGVGGGAVQHAQ
jgi:hypothetical protein